MPDLSLDREAQLKAASIAARRARRAPWQNAHCDKLARDREARRLAQEYRQAQREAEKLNGKACDKCGETKPPSEYDKLPSGNLRGSCKDCRAMRKADRRHELQDAKRDARDSAKAVERAALLAAEAERRRKRATRKRKVTPEQQLQAAERIAHLTSLLKGNHPGLQLTSEKGWDVASSELQRLWLQSGDKVCTGCGSTVPPTFMLPPFAANFYPGKCRTCARVEFEEDRLKTFGRLSVPRLIPMRDGSSITVAELARRHRERSSPPAL